MLRLRFSPVNWFCHSGGKEDEEGRTIWWPSTLAHSRGPLNPPVRAQFILISPSFVESIYHSRVVPCGRPFCVRACVCGARAPTSASLLHLQAPPRTRFWTALEAEGLGRGLGWLTGCLHVEAVCVWVCVCLLCAHMPLVRAYVRVLLIRSTHTCVREARGYYYNSLCGVCVCAFVCGLATCVLRGYIDVSRNVCARVLESRWTGGRQIALVFRYTAPKTPTLWTYASFTYAFHHSRCRAALARTLVCATGARNLRLLCQLS